MEKLFPAPPALDGRSYWLREALQDEPDSPSPPLVGSARADVCVVGGGFEGLWTAYELTEIEPSIDVVVLEADICGAGGSGANGGFFSASWDELEKLIRLFGEGEGIRYARAIADQWAEVEQWCARHGVDISGHRDGCVFVRAGEWQDRVGQQVFRQLEAAGCADKLRPLSPTEVRAYADSPRMVGGLFTPDLATIQPAKLVRALRRVLLERGVRIHEGTPVQRLEYGRPVRLVVAAGCVIADQVVLATGSWSGSFPAFRRAFTVVSEYMVVTEPVPDRLEEIGWTSHVGIVDSRRTCYYLRKTDDGRIAIGGGTVSVGYGHRVRRARRSVRKVRSVAAGLCWLFPQLTGVRVAHAWTGPTDITAAGVPFFISSPERNVHAGMGFSGHGLAPSRVGAKTLASLVLERDDEWASLPVVGPPISLVPHEPLRWPLVQLVAWAHESGERAEERGRTRGALRRFICSSFAKYQDGQVRNPRRGTVAFRRNDKSDP